MTWSIFGAGKPRALGAKLASDLAKINCSEPEQTIKNKVGDIIVAALSVFPEGLPVKIEASGSQWCPDHKKSNELGNTVVLKIEPISGFVE